MVVCVVGCLCGCLVVCLFVCSALLVLFVAVAVVVVVVVVVGVFVCLFGCLFVCVCVSGWLVGCAVVAVVVGCCWLLLVVVVAVVVGVVVAVVVVGGAGCWCCRCCCVKRIVMHSEPIRSQTHSPVRIHSNTSKKDNRPTTAAQPNATHNCDITTSHTQRKARTAIAQTTPSLVCQARHVRSLLHPAAPDVGDPLLPCLSWGRPQDSPFNTTDPTRFA